MISLVGGVGEPPGDDIDPWVPENNRRHQNQHRQKRGRGLEHHHTEHLVRGQGILQLRDQHGAISFSKQGLSSRDWYVIFFTVHVESHD